MTKAENLQAISIATRGDVYDHEYNGGEWMHEAAETQETFEDFIESSKNWAERCTMKRGVVGGCNFIVWKSMQVRKGAQRRSLRLASCQGACVVELAERCLACVKRLALLAARAGARQDFPGA